MKRYTLCTLLSALLFVACQTDYTADLGLNGDGTTTLTITTAKTRTYLGAKEGDSYPVYWSEGDRIVVNGNLSEEAVIDNNNPSSAQFTIDVVLSYPLSILYTGGSTDSALFPSEQLYELNSIKSGYAPMYGYATSQSSTIQLKHLAGILDRKSVV